MVGVEGVRQKNTPNVSKGHVGCSTGRFGGGVGARKPGVWQVVVEEKWVMKPTQRVKMTRCGGRVG